jgi:hypothetical protein
MEYEAMDLDFRRALERAIERGGTAPQSEAAPSASSAR